MNINFDIVVKDCANVLGQHIILRTKYITLKQILPHDNQIIEQRKSLLGQSESLVPNSTFITLMGRFKIKMMSITENVISV